MQFVLFSHALSETTHRFGNMNSAHILHSFSKTSFLLSFLNVVSLLLKTGGESTHTQWGRGGAFALRGYMVKACLQSHSSKFVFNANYLWKGVYRHRTQHCIIFDTVRIQFLTRRSDHLYLSLVLAPGKCFGNTVGQG